MPNTLLIICCVCFCVILCSSSGVSAYFSNEGNSLSKTEPGNLCDNYNKNNKDSLHPYVCPYGRDACKLHTNDGYSTIFCPFNYALVADKPSGTRSRTITSILDRTATKEDIYNENYFIKKDDRKIKQINYNKTSNSFSDITASSNSDSLINVYNNGLINMSLYDTGDQYIYVSYKLLIDFNVSLSTQSLQINTLDDFNTILNTLKNDISCDNLIKKNIGNDIYKTQCLFYNVGNIPDISDTFIKTFIPIISKDILVSYFAALKLKLSVQNKLSLFEYVMYISLENYLNNRNWKYLINTNNN